MKISRLALPFVLGLATLNAASITLTPGSLLVQQIAIPLLTTANLEDFSKSGTLLSSAQDSGTHDIAENLTVLNGNLYVSDGAGYINKIDLTTGAVSSSFFVGTFGLNGLGSLNSNLLALTYSGTAVQVFSTAGALLQTINLSSLPTGFSWNGIASDGTTLYLADSHSGSIYEYSTTGALLGSIATSAAGGLTGVSYDSSNNSLWIVNTTNNEAYDISTSSTVLSQFSLGGFRPGSGIAVVPGTSSVTTPEPASSAFFGLSLALLGFFRLRQPKSR